MRKWITRAQLVARREKEEGSAGAVRDTQLAQRLHPRLRTMPVDRQGEHAERLPSEMLLVLFPGMRGEIGAHFSLEARLQKIGAGDGHRATVDLDDKGMAGAVRELESEDEVRDKADLVHGSLVRELHAQRASPV